MKQGCPILPLLFGLYFDGVVKYIKTHMATTDTVQVAQLMLQAALYAGDIILMAPNTSSLRTQLTCPADFATAEHLWVSKEMTLVLLKNCTGKVDLDGTELQEVMESKYLGML